MKTKFLIPLIAGLGLLCACKGKTNKDSGDFTDSPAIAKRETAVPKSDPVQTENKLVKTADINFEVNNVQQTAENISALTTKYNGMVVHHVMESVPGRTDEIPVSGDSILKVTTFNETANMIVKIPPARMEDFANQVLRLGLQINNLKLNVSDKSLDYLAAQLKLKNRSDALKQQKNESSGDALNDKDNLINRKIENLKIDDSVKRSILSLSFYANNIIKKKMIANESTSAYNPPFFRRMGLSIAYGWEIVVDIFIELTKVWILIPIGIAGWLAYKRFFYKKKEELVKIQ